MTLELTSSTAPPDTSAAARLLLRGVRKKWDRKKPPVLSDIDLELGSGTIVSLIGENGVGKTTLLRIVAGLIYADEGEVRLDGLDPRRDRVEYQRRLGFLSAGSAGLYARMTARQHLEFAGRVGFLRAAERRVACEEALARFELGEFASQRVDRISMGQRQRVRLAMTFVRRPQLVLLDEPWNSLDEKGTQVVAKTLAAFREAGGTAICCTPTGVEINAAMNEIDQALRLTDGKLDRA